MRVGWARRERLTLMLTHGFTAVLALALAADPTPTLEAVAPSRGVELRLKPIVAQVLSAEVEQAGSGLALLYRPREGFAIGLSGTYHWLSRRPAQPTDGLPGPALDLPTPTLTQWAALVTTEMTAARGEVQVGFDFLVASGSRPSTVNGCTAGDLDTMDRTARAGGLVSDVAVSGGCNVVSFSGVDAATGRNRGEDVSVAKNLVLNPSNELVRHANLSLGVSWTF
jgi:hypothetical protein